MSIDKPLVSVGLPVYNGEKTIGRTIESLLAQDYKNIEIIISDNASKDSTPEICRRYTEKSSFVKLNRNRVNLGLIENCHIVLEMARGSYFMWAGDDDQHLPVFVSTLVNELESHPEAGVAMCAVNKIDNSGEMFDTARFNGSHNPNNKSYFEMATLVAWMPMWYNVFICGLHRTNLLKQVVSKYPDDYFHERLLLCSLALSKSFRYVDAPLFNKTVYKPGKKREWRSEDPFYNKRFSERSFIKWATVLTSSVFKLHTIPWHRKVYVLGPLCRRAAWELQRTAVVKSCRKIKKSIFIFLIEYYRKICPQRIQNIIRRIRHKGFDPTNE